MSVIEPYRRSIANRREEIEQAIQNNWFAYLLLVPTMGAIALIMWLPFLRGIWMSFHNWPFGTGTHTWVGMENYIEIMGMQEFQDGLVATAVYMSATVVHMIVGLLAVLLIANLSSGYYKAFFSGVFLLGYTLPPVTTGVLWRFLLNAQFGAFWNLLIEYGILNETVYWTVNADTAQAGITAVASWTFWPFVFLIVLATRESIPTSHYESARVYGANTAQIFTNITFPQLKTALLIALILRTLNNFRKVGQPFIITEGGPGYHTSIVGVLLYRFAWQEGRLGMAYAFGMVMFILSLSTIILFIREFERESEESEAIGA